METAANDLPPQSDWERLIQEILAFGEKFGADMTAKEQDVLREDHWEPILNLLTPQPLTPTIVPVRARAGIQSFARPPPTGS